MLAIRHMLDTHPSGPANVGPASRTITAALECAAVCSTCADACLSELDVKALADCIRLDLDCADICATTAQVVARSDKPGAQPMQAILAACAAACRACAEECRRHALHHRHCEICAETCERCEAACDEMMRTFRHASSEPHRPNDEPGWARGTV